MSLVRAEFRKLTRRKLYPVMLSILAFLMLMTAALFYLVIPAIPDIAGDAPVLQRPEAFTFGAQQVAGQAWWFAVILATAVLGSEVAGTVWATSLTRDSRKAAHIAARLFIFGAAAWLAFLVGTLAWSVVTFIGAGGTGAPEVGEWLGWVWRFALIAGAWTSLGLAAVAITRSVGPAIGIALGISFLDSIVAPFVEPYENISLTAASNAIFEVGGDTAFSIFIPGGEMSLIHSVLIMVGWALVGLILTWWGFQRRDA